MLDKLGDMKDMIGKYRKLQKVLSNLVIRAKEEGVVIDMTGEMKLKQPNPIKIEDE